MYICPFHYSQEQIKVMYINMFTYINIHYFQSFKLETTNQELSLQLHVFILLVL